MCPPGNEKDRFPPFGGKYVIPLSTGKQKSRFPPICGRRDAFASTYACAEQLRQTLLLQLIGEQNCRYRVVSQPRVEQLPLVSLPRKLAGMVSSARRRSTRETRPRLKFTWRDFKTSKLVPAFKELRALGIYARNDQIQFCSSDAHLHLRLAANGVPEGTPNRHLKATEFMKKEDRSDERSYVGYHMQSVPMCKEEWQESFGGMYLLHSLKPEETQPVRQVFLKRGLAVEWEGDEAKCILVRPPKAPGPLWDKLRTHVRMRSIFFYWHGLTHHLHAAGDETSDMRQRSNIRYDSSMPDSPPAGLDPTFNSLHFNRSITFSPPRDMEERMDSGNWKYFEGSERGDESDDDSAELSDADDWKVNIEFYWNGGDVSKLELTPVSRFDDEKADRADNGDEDADPFVELKGAELDAIAFRGADVTFASYDTMGGAFTGTKKYDAPAGNCFTVAELLSVLEQHLRWLARAEQFQRKLNIDHCFFEGLHERDGDAALYVRWGS
jgi:hypothetical protein